MASRSRSLWLVCFASRLLNEEPRGGNGEEGMERNGGLISRYRTVCAQKKGAVYYSILSLFEYCSVRAGSVIVCLRASVQGGGGGGRIAACILSIDSVIITSRRSYTTPQSTTGSQNPEPYARRRGLDKYRHSPPPRVPDPGRRSRVGRGLLTVTHFVEQLNSSRGIASSSTVHGEELFNTSLTALTSSSKGSRIHTHPCLGRPRTGR
jgi:hypothetical protein